MAFERGLRSIGGLKRGTIKYCTRPALTVRQGSGDLTSNNSSFYFTPSSNLTPLGDFNNPIHFSQQWCLDHSNTGGAAWPSAVTDWYDLCMLEMRLAGDAETKYALCVQIGFWKWIADRDLVTFGIRGQIRKVSDDTVVKNLPVNNNCVGAQQSSWYPADGVIVCIQEVELNGVHYLTFTCGTNNYRWDPTIIGLGSGFSVNIDDPSVWAPTGYTPHKWDVDDPNDDDEGENNEDESGGSHTRHWDPVPYPTLPTIGISAGGFVTPYNLTPAEMGTFGMNCFDPDIWTAIKNYFQQPQDFVAGCLLVPFNPPASAMWKPRFGTTPWPTPYAKLDSDFYELDCGTIHVDGYYGSFLDYSPYTKLTLWLPYIGYVELNPDEFTDDNLHVKYHIDCITGACTVLVSTGIIGSLGAEQILAQFTGNCGVQIPTARSSFDAAVGNAINLITTLAVTAATGAAGGVVEENLAASGAKNAAANAENHMVTREANQASQLTGAGAGVIASMKPSVSRNGSPGSTSGYLGVQKPYLIKELPRQARAGGYRELKGYPANLGGTLSAFSGYCEVSDIALNNIPATVDEIEEIYDLLKGGIFI